MNDNKQIDGQAEPYLLVEESGIFTWRLESNVVQGDSSLAKVFGVVPRSRLQVRRSKISLPHPTDDRPRVAESIHHAILTGDPYHEFYQVLSGAGFGEIAAFGRCFRDAEGIPSQYVGVALDGSIPLGGRRFEIKLGHVMANKVA
jgi:PAS domain-containing protein